MWSAANQLIWAKYFRALSLLERAKTQSAEAPELVAEASRILEGTDSGLVDPQVTRLRIIVRALAHVLQVQPSITLERARSELRLQGQMFGEEEADVASLEFLDATQQVLADLETVPGKALADGAIDKLVSALERLPTIGEDLARAVRPRVGETAVDRILGPRRAWIYRVIESISDEATLRKLLIRLIQSSVPRYAQIRHGPTEFGKDVVVVVEAQGETVLRMYQVKAGNISAPVWRSARHELEEMYLVPTETLQLGTTVARREGILICNGHALDQPERTMGPWFDEQRRAYGRDFKFMHLDDLVHMIIENRLVNDFEAIAAELGIDTAKSTSDSDAVDA
jgi:hypothetical protein